MVETRKKYKKVEKLQNFQNSPKTFPKTLFDHVLHDYFDGKKLCPVHPGDSKKFHRNRKEFKFSKMSKNVSKIVQTCFDVIFSRFFGQCTLEGRDVEKFQRNAKTSQNSRYPNTFPKVSKQVLNLFWGFFSKKKVPSAPWRVETWKNLRKIEKLNFFFKMTKIFPKSVQTRFQHSSRQFFLVKKIDQCTLEGRNFEKFEKQSKTIWNFKSVQKRSWKCPNKFWNCFEVIFFGKKYPVHPGESKLGKTPKNEKLSIFQNAQKTFPKAIKHVLNLFRGNCFGKICA